MSEVKFEKGDTITVELVVAMDGMSDFGNVAVNLKRLNGPDTRGYVDPASIIKHTKKPWVPAVGDKVVYKSWHPSEKARHPYEIRGFVDGQWVVGVSYDPNYRFCIKAINDLERYDQPTK